jgi:hypothetical protein
VCAVALPCIKFPYSFSSTRWPKEGDRIDITLCSEFTVSWRHGTNCPPHTNCTSYPKFQIIQRHLMKSVIQYVSFWLYVTTYSELRLVRTNRWIKGSFEHRLVKQPAVLLLRNLEPKDDARLLSCWVLANVGCILCQPSLKKWDTWKLNQGTQGPSNCYTRFHGKYLHSVRTIKMPTKLSLCQAYSQVCHYHRKHTSSYITWDQIRRCTAISWEILSEQMCT